MFKVGDKIKTLPVKSNTDLANELYAGRNGTIESISFPYGLHKQYKIRYDEPFYDHGYKVEVHYYYDWENGFELRE